MSTIALVGCAHIHTPGFIKRIKDRPDVKVKAIWDHDPQRAGKRADELGAPAVADAGAIFANREVEAVIVCSETNRHADLVPPAARAGKHLFVEKPLGFAADDAYAMAGAIEKAGVLFQTGYFMRGDPKHQLLKTLIAQSAFGTITRLRLSNCHGGALGGWFDAEWRWMADPAVAGCGAFGDLGTHALDLMLWFLGPVLACTAALARGTARYGDCDETGEGLLKFQSGTLGTLAAAWDDVANPVTLLLSGTEGHASIINGQLYLQSARVDGADGKRPWEKLPPALPHAFELFLDAVAGKEGVPLVGPAEAAYRSAVMEAMYQAAASGTWVTPRKG